MPALRPSRLLLLLCLAASLQAQAPASAPAPVAPPTPPAQVPAQRAKITFTSGQLNIVADNSSLNQILHEISQLTGITVTGSVAEERVFGNYGPGTPSEVFDQLLDGTSTNILFIASSGTKPSELILTPRSGVPTPPSRNPASHTDDTNDDANAQPVYPPPPPDPDAAAQTSPAQAAPAANPAAAPAPPTAPADTNQQQSPNNVKTPQQIYDQLMKMRQQQQ